MVEVETRCGDGRATHVPSIEGSWSIVLRGEGEEDGGETLLSHFYFPLILEPKK